MNHIKTIAVYCGANTGNKTEFSQAATQLARALCEQDITLVYGGATVGLMGVLANTMLSQHGKVIGVIPSSMLKHEVAHQSLSEQVVVDSMHERKAIMSDLADAFILLPGGFGSLDEFFETLTWLQLGYHHKPCGILNVQGYYDDLIRFIDHAVTHQFVKPAHQAAIIIESSPKPLLSGLANTPPLKTEKWIRA